nr:hypothetical protein [Candidatus Aminicenantes bacterium]NIM82299.1 hypothetical protein [Candidatus Aminicenantes bacterium]NIN21682.1 hypothetical protein [Candidatus Aminicenantes bacterium]NIN45491.1 hypothetical protein [Candidatus Aminicenantes bacterium]NIN88322.1 hypothetical protein [Candidatus Aminicenantes bacterium]
DIPPIVITAFRKLNKPFEFARPLSEIKEIELSYRDNFFSFEFVALNYINSDKNQYAYMLEGFDDDWVNCGTRRFADYTNVPPGTYVFRVKGSNNDGVWNNQGASIKIIIIPPIWRTWWFRTLCLFGAVVLLYLWYRARVKRLTLRLKTEAEMERLFIKYNISPREQEIIHLILRGKSNREIEDTLFISLTTVKTHVYNIYKKFGAKNRLELIHFIQKSPEK